MMRWFKNVLSALVVGGILLIETTNAEAHKAIPPQTVLPTVTYDTWLERMCERLEKSGFSPTTLRVLRAQKLDPRVLKLLQKQPELRVDFSTYYRKRAPSIVTQGRKEALKHQRILEKVSKTFRIPLGVILALWGIESHYGRNTGTFNTLRSLTTLAYASHRRDFFENELKTFLTLIESKKLKRGFDTHGSWAGAVGHCQFMPSSVEKYSHDMDQDGAIDLWGSISDVAASIASYLRHHQWQEQQDWSHFKVRAAQSVEHWIGQGATLGEWVARGLTGINALEHQKDQMAKLYRIDDTYYLTHQNFDILMIWNRSTKFALSVALLAEALQNG